MNRIKHIISVLLLIFMAISFAHAFLVENNLGVEKSYFSINNPDVFIKTQNNISNYSVLYSISGNNYEETFNFSNCAYGSCSSFSLLDLIQMQNGTFAGSTEFEIKVENISRFVYLDFEKPKFQILTSIINESEKVLELTFNYSDNSGFVEKVELYKLENSSQIFIEDLTNKTSFSYNIESVGYINFLFKVTDPAGNTLEEIVNISIHDIFEPKIISYKVINNNGVFSLTFEVKDHSLKEYSIIQGNISLTESISGSSFSKSVSLPFDDSEIILRVIDNSGNIVQQTIDLKSPFSYSFRNIFSNEKIFEFNSNAKECRLVTLDGNSENILFSKSSNSFSAEIPVSIAKIYELSIYCENSNYREYFKTDFFFDNIPPSMPELSYTLEDDGTIFLSWTQSIDNQSEVSYRLYRDEKEIYSGKRNNFRDLRVSYPNQYNYFLSALDEAGNSVKTDNLILVPRKTNIFFNSNIENEQKVEDNIFSLVFETDKNSDIHLRVLNSGITIFEEVFRNISSSNFANDLNLSEGKNEIYLKIEDFYGNIHEETYFIEYSPQLLAKIESEQITDNAILPPIEPIREITESEIQEQNNDESTQKLISNFWWILLFISFIVLIFFILVLFIKESDLKTKMKHYGKRKYRDYERARKTDMILGKDLEKAKKERILKEQRAAREKQKQIEKSKKERSELEKKKHEDLQRKKNILIPFSQREKAKKRVKRIKKELSEDEIIDRNNNKTKPKGFFNYFNKEKSPKKDDEFLNYLQNRKSISYDNPRDYRVREEKIPEKPKDEVKKHEDVKVSKDMKEQEKSTEKELDKNINNKVDKKKDRLILDDYLDKRTKRKRTYFAEKEVNRDLFRRNKN